MVSEPKPTKDDKKSIRDKKQKEEPDPEEVIKAFPEESRPTIRGFFESLSIQPFVNPVLKQINPQHVTDALKFADDKDKRDRKERNNIRWFFGLVFLVLIISFFYLIHTLIDRNPNLLTDIIKYGITFIGGGGLGFGISEYRHRKK